MATLNTVWDVSTDDMRGSESVEANIYECIDCGERKEDPDGRLCSCGGYLRNISVERNL